MRALLLVLLLQACAMTPPACPAPGRWVAPADLRPVADPVPGLASHSVVLLGENHDSAADHRWQLATIARLYAADPRLVLGFEMFRRQDQPALDAWTRGALGESAFLAAVDWEKSWGFPASLYLPLFRWARDHRVPMLALNVSHTLVRRTARSGWASVPAAEREGVATPAPADPAYRAFLAEAMGGHTGSSGAGLDRFVEAQLVWDGAMAQAIAAERRRSPGLRLVAIMGAGHLEHRWGVPHQLAALGTGDAAVLLPFHPGPGPCAPPGPGDADALFVD